MSPSSVNPHRLSQMRRKHPLFLPLFRSTSNSIPHPSASVSCLALQSVHPAAVPHQLLESSPPSPLAWSCQLLMFPSDRLQTLFSLLGRLNLFSGSREAIAVWFPPYLSCLVPLSFLFLLAPVFLAGHSRHTEVPCTLTFAYSTSLLQLALQSPQDWTPRSLFQSFQLVSMPCHRHY